MSDPPASPPAGRLATPSWLDTRLVLGVLLVLVSVVVGARVLASADRSTLVWSTTRDLAAGAALAADDLAPAQVRLFGSSDGYLPASGDPPLGYVLERPVAAGELLPLRALTRPGEDDERRLVAVPVLPGHYPPSLARGQQVDVWSSPDPAGADPAAPGTQLVLERLTVEQAPDAGGGLSGATPERSVVLVVPPDDVEVLLTALAQGRIDLVRVPGPGSG